MFGHHRPIRVAYMALYTSDTYGLLKKLIDEENQNVIPYCQYCNDMSFNFILFFYHQ